MKKLLLPLLLAAGYAAATLPSAPATDTVAPTAEVSPAQPRVQIKGLESAMQGPPDAPGGLEVMSAIQVLRQSTSAANVQDAWGLLTDAKKAGNPDADRVLALLIAANLKP